MLYWLLRSRRGGIRLAMVSSLSDANFKWGDAVWRLMLSAKSNDLQQCQVLVSAMVEAFEGYVCVSS